MIDVESSLAPDDCDDELEIISTQDLLRELIERDVLTETEVTSILLGVAPNTVGGVDDPIGRARDELCRGNRTEAMIWLERALGGDFVGRLAVTS